MPCEIIFEGSYFVPMCTRREQDRLTLQLLQVQIVIPYIYKLSIQKQYLKHHSSVNGIAGNQIGSYTDVHEARKGSLNPSTATSTNRHTIYTRLYRSNISSIRSVNGIAGNQTGSYLVLMCTRREQDHLTLQLLEVQIIIRYTRCPYRSNISNIRSVNAIAGNQIFECSTNPLLSKHFLCIWFLCKCYVTTLRSRASWFTLHNRNCWNLKTTIFFFFKNFIPLCVRIGGTCNICGVTQGNEWALGFRSSFWTPVMTRWGWNRLHSFPNNCCAHSLSWGPQMDRGRKAWDVIIGL